MKFQKFIILFILLEGCLSTIKNTPSSMKITPDTVQNASVVKQAYFYIDCRGNEILKSFRITTYPPFYQLDTVLPPLSHTYIKKLYVTIPQKIQDSMMNREVEFEFELFDTYTSIKQKRKVRISNPYKPLYVDSARLYFHKDSAFFYSFGLAKKLKITELTNTNFDLVFVYNNNSLFTICSPNAPFVRQELYKFPLDYAETNKNITFFERTYIQENQITEPFVFLYTVRFEYIANSQSNGIGVSNLINNNVIAFKTSDNRKGFIVIKNIDFSRKSLTFKYYIQGL